MVKYNCIALDLVLGPSLMKGSLLLSGFYVPEFHAMDILLVLIYSFLTPLLFES